MSKRLSLRLGAWIIATLVLALGGCSAVRLTYSQGPALLYWWADGYVDFSAEQTPSARAAIDEWFGWHRRSQLADYAALLAQLQVMAVRDVTPQQVCRVYDDLQQRLARAYDRAVPLAAPLVRTLSPAQIDHLDKRYNRSHEDARREYLQPDALERQDAALKRTVDRAESIYGSLDAVQRQRLAADLQQSPFNPEVWLAERRARQLDILRTLRALLAARADAGAVEAALRAFAAHAEQSPRAEYRAYRDRLEQANCQLMSRLHNGMRDEQRQHAAQTLRGWAEDLRALAAD